MTELTEYTIYKITNTIDDMIYIGSTKKPKRKSALSNRFNGHKSDARRGVTLPLYDHMRLHGEDKFNIESIKVVKFDNRIESLKEEQLEIEKYDKGKLFNKMRAYTVNTEKTRDIVKKRKVRRDFYNRKMQDPLWADAERERNKLRMRKKRELKKDQRQRLNGYGLTEE